MFSVLFLVFRHSLVYHVLVESLPPSNPQTLTRPSLSVPCEHFLTSMLSLTWPGELYYTSWCHRTRIIYLRSENLFRRLTKGSQCFLPLEFISHTRKCSNTGGKAEFYIENAKSEVQWQLIMRKLRGKLHRRWWVMFSQIYSRSLKVNYPDVEHWGG